MKGKKYRLSNLSKDIIIRNQRKEIERLKQENKKLKDYITKAKEEIKRQVGGIIGALHGG